MVSPDEVEALMQETSLSFSEIAEPYPDWMEYPDGTKITFGWVLMRGADGNCLFLRVVLLYPPKQQMLAQRFLKQ